MEYSKDNVLGNEVLKLLKKFGGKELAVKEQDASNISVVYYSPKTSPSWITKTVKNPPHCVLMNMTPITIICSKSSFEGASIEEIRARLFHALMRINFDDSGNFYKLVSPDVNDFTAILSKLGLYYEKANDIFSNVQMEELPI